ncbi:LAQU0S01e10044g1_1 [Lachancea quebecensis]|uniref:LAQU0S01e10044g1_1 n=1 Tax=Lachancea quebecensis TaxID=1654605 RepID=A0A0P1KM99_9SACH|nr:LAQU0S01e10044g1_1 [Lachancea quebecensis]
MTQFLWIQQPRTNDDSGSKASKNSQPETPEIGVTGTFAMMGGPGDDVAARGGMIQTTKKGIILNPQPSKSKRDPLNWPVWRRDTALFVVGWHCFVGGGQTSILAAGSKGLALEFHRSLSDVSYLVGGMMLALALGSIIASPCAVIFGKRVVYLVGIIIFFFGSIGCAVSQNYESLLASRIISGLGVSTIESLPSATVAEIYFAHERAYRLGFYTLLLLGGKNLVPLLASFVFENLDRHWLFWIVTIIVGVDFMLHVFFVPETFWDRAPVPNERSIHETAIARAADEARNLTISDHSAPKFQNEEDISLSKSLSPGLLKSVTPTQSHHYLSGMKAKMKDSAIGQSHLVTGLGIFHGRHSVDKWTMVMLRPFVLFCYPAVLFGAFLYSLAIVWLIMVAQIINTVYGNPPYSFGSIQIGLVYISPFVGSILGSICAGPLSDKMVRQLAKNSCGIYEPEFRLLMVLPAGLSTALGLMGFGWSAQAHDAWIAPTIFLGVVGFGSSLASTTAITFTVDSYKCYAQEALVTLNVLKNVMGFAFSFFNTKFNVNSGYKTAFVVYGCVELIVCLFAIPLYHYGKRARRWTDSKGLLDFSYVKKKHSGGFTEGG